MRNQRAYNKQQETKNLIGTPKQRRKKYAQIVKEMGARGITMEDLSKNDLNGKQVGFLDMMKETGMTMDEAVVLQQYSKAIIDRDTKSAEFLRDTAGEKPSTQIDMSMEESGLSKMSLEDLLELKGAILAMQNKDEE